MSVRRQTLEEWFLCHQLRALARTHFYNPVLLDSDVTEIARRWEARGERPPWTAILIKAIALTAERHPSINRVVFSTFYGTRVVEPPTIDVNFPHTIREGGREYLIASTIPRANERPVSEIRDLVRAAGDKRLADTLIAKHFEKNANTFWMRGYLRFVHFVAYNFPALFLKRGGGALSVSSLLNHAAEDFSVHAVAYGPTALTLSAASVAREGERLILKVGVGFDHFAGHGNDLLRAVKELDRLLRAESERFE